MSQGKELTYEQQVAIVQVKKYMDNEKSQGKEASTRHPALRTARALNVSLSTVKQVLAAARKNQGVVERRAPKSRGHPPLKITSHEVATVRHMMQEAHLRGELVTVPKLQTWLQEQGTVVSNWSLRRALLRMGFSYGHASRRSAWKEREDVVANRRAYLAALRAHRDPQGRTIRPEIYMDETLVHVNHNKRFTWNEEGTLVNMPSGVGARLIIVDAIIQDDRGETYGWVPGAHLHFKSGLRTGDYHGAMHFENFHKWMLTQLLPNLPAHALIIFDNAPYHNTLTEETFPQSSTKKAELQQWLQAHHIAFDDWLLKPALYDLCRQHAPPPEYAIDRLVTQFGCDILRTPQYHPALQPIEHAWGIAKSHIAETQTGEYTLKSLRGRLQPACDKVTPEVCKNLFAHVRQEEERYWQVDEKLDEMWTSNRLG
jgi:transposase